MFFIDYWYIVLVLPAFIFSIWAQFKVSGTFKKYSKVFNSKHLTGAEAARQVLLDNGVSVAGITHTGRNAFSGMEASGVQIAQVPGRLSDHFDPRTNTIYLSEEVFGSTSVAALGVAAHEAGHAVQYAKGYVPMKVRAVLVPVTKIGSMLSFPLLLIGIILMAYENVAATGEAIMIAGIVLFGTVALFQLVTQPVEFNASRRALTALDGGSITLSDEEYKGSRKVLSAAAMTYVAALAVSLAQLLRWILILTGGRRR